MIHDPEAAYAGPHRGTEGLAFDANGRKRDSGFHEEILRDEDDDSFAVDLEEFVKLSQDGRQRFLDERIDHPGRQAELCANCSTDPEAFKTPPRKVTAVPTDG